MINCDCQLKKNLVKENTINYRDMCVFLWMNQLGGKEKKKV
jgi:hypothetical protein